MKFQLTIAVAVVCVVAACGTTRRQNKKAPAAESQKIDVQRIAQEMNASVQHSARTISLETDDREVRRMMILWQIDMLEVANLALHRPDPRWALIDLWAALYQFKVWLERGGDKGRLSAQKDDVMEVLDRLLLLMRHRAGGVLTAKQVDQVDAGVREWAESHPIEGDVLNAPRGPAASRGSGGIFNVVMAVPEGIFTIGSGVKDTSVSISEVASAASRGVDVMSTLPLISRLQTELLIYSLEESEAVQKLLQDVSQVSDTVAGVGKTAEGLPDRIEEAAIRAIERVEETQPAFRKTLEKGDETLDKAAAVVDSARKTIDGIGPVLDKVKDNGQWVERASEHLTHAGRAWEGAFEQINLMRKRDPNQPPPPPMDFKDLATTAEYATKAAEEVHATVVELRAMLEGEGLTRVGATTNSAIGRLTWSLVIVILVFFATLVGYRFVAARIR